MRTTKTARWGAWLLTAWLSCATAWAAGGHHAVDDAAILGPGECELETWVGHASGRGGNLLHAGGGCRVGPVQLGLASQYARSGGSSQTSWGFEAKWARQVAEGFSIGVALQPALHAHVHPRYEGTGLVALATWTPREDLALHLNLGRDFMNRGEDRNRGGIALEWTLLQRWSLLAERYLEQDTHFARGGLRWLGTANWSVDVSRAQRISGPHPSSWTLGLTYTFGKD